MTQADIFSSPSIPSSAQGYSLEQNVLYAVRVSEDANGVVQPLLLMHNFLAGMPPAGDEQRELASTLGEGSSDVSLFDKVFDVPLPMNECLAGMHHAGSLPKPYKTDIVVYDHPDRGTLKVTQWHQDDPRGEMPHNHPWADDSGLSFISLIVRGGYDETLTHREGSTITRTHKAGDLNIARYDSFHTVSNIQPGTLTILMTAPRAIAQAGLEWGYLLFEDGQPVVVGMKDPRVKDTSFLARAAVQNPSLRNIAYGAAR